MRLSLREATAFALQGNLDIQIAGLNPRIREAQITEEKGIFDVEGRAALLASNTRLLDTSTTFLDELFANRLAGRDDSQQQELSVGVAQLTPYGGSYEVRVSETHLGTSRRVVGNALEAGRTAWRTCKNLHRRGRTESHAATPEKFWLHRDAKPHPHCPKQSHDFTRGFSSTGHCGHVRGPTNLLGPRVSSASPRSAEPATRPC